MKLCRYGELGAEKPALVGPDGQLRDLSAHVPDIGPEQLAPAVLARLAGLDPARLPPVTGQPRIAAPVALVSKFIGIGLNYRDHAQESGLAIPAEPIVFMKAPSSISGPYDPIVQPPHSSRLDWEVELGVVIGTKAQYVSEAAALDHVAGYCIVNDISERAFQMQSSQWDKGKGCDTFGPIGPWLVTTDEIPDPQSLGMRLDLNGKRMQDGNSGMMIFGVSKLIAYCSQYMTLLPGDIIATGTPAGVGMGIKPSPVWLQEGDVVEPAIAGLGAQRQVVVKRQA